MTPEEVSAFIDGELPAAEAAAMADHVSRCEPCRGELERSRAVDDAIRHQPADPGLAGMRAALLRRVRPRWRHSAARVAVAAAVLAAVVILVRMSGSLTGDPRSDGRKPAYVASSMLESLELDAASLRLALAVENPDPEVRHVLDRRLDAVMKRLEALRARTQSN
jgi:anti-sigma factor RsiW